MACHRGAEWYLPTAIACRPVESNLTCRETELRLQRVLVDAWAGHAEQPVSTAPVGYSRKA
eukprot:1812817-Amphidinium_carterae.1